MIALKCFIYNQYIKIKNIKKIGYFFLQSFSHIIIIGSTWWCPHWFCEHTHTHIIKI